MLSRIISLSLIITGILLLPASLCAQETDLNHGFTKTEWDNISARWERLQPYARIILISGDTIQGQLYYSDENSILIFRGKKIPLSSTINGRMDTIPISDIKMLLYYSGGPRYTGLMIGGIGMGGAGFVGGIILAGGWSVIPGLVLGAAGLGGGGWTGNKIQNKNRNDEIILSAYGGIESLRTKSLVDQNEIYNSPDLLLKASKEIRRIFPDKHLRISFSTSIGPNTVRKSLEKMIKFSDLPGATEYRHGPLAFEFLDVSWRFSDKLITGAQIYLNSDSYTYMFYADYMEEPPANLGIGYHYDIQLFESRIYAEYAITPVTRYFSRKYELLLGGGIILSQPYINFTYDYIPDPLAGDISWIEKRTSFTKPGIQARTAIHYYPFPGFSVFAGAEANLILPVKVPAYSFPASNPGGSLETLAHKLNFSTIRIKIGACIYF